MAEADLGFALGLPPQQAVDYLRAKRFDVSWDWHDTLAEAHDKAFVVAKMARYRLLAQTRQIVDDMLSSGETEAAAAAKMEDAMRRAGW